MRLASLLTSHTRLRLTLIEVRRGWTPTPSPSPCSSTLLHRTHVLLLPIHPTRGAAKPASNTSILSILLLNVEDIHPSCAESQTSRRNQDKAKGLVAVLMSLSSYKSRLMRHRGHVTSQSSLINIPSGPEPLGNGEADWPIPTAPSRTHARPSYSLKLFSDTMYRQHSVVTKRIGIVPIHAEEYPGLSIVHWV